MTHAFPWARTYDADQLAAFMHDLAAAASGDRDLATLDAVEEVIAKHAPLPADCPLTRRQIEVLTAAASGETNESTARSLNVSVATVKSTRADLSARLQARTTSHACIIAMHYGWLTDYRVPPPTAAPTRRGPITKSSRHAGRAYRLRRSPGTELAIGDYGSRNTAYRASRQITTGALPAYTPRGAFEARVFLSRSRRWVVAARYVGAPATTIQEGPAS
ncbi:response regulator transcription factor [Streptomyces coelicoflavus]|uniref:response regulator transcription factor n=1 Tax=Streptomyces coelicoflavus TaxID=285562 RepID=UPI0036630709